jgi:hypothetical protein
MKHTQNGGLLGPFFPRIKHFDELADINNRLTQAQFFWVVSNVSEDHAASIFTSP